MTKNTDYNENINDLEDIRRRPRMFIGKLGNGPYEYDGGIYTLLKEVVDNAIDEFISGAGQEIEVSISPKGQVTVRDYGRGIPFDEMEWCLTHYGPSIKRYNEVYYFSVGYEGTGLKAVNALSADSDVISFHDGQFVSFTFEDGKLISKKQEDTTEKNGTLVRFIPDQVIFPGFSFNLDFVRKSLWRNACLNTGLMLYLNGELFHSDNGLLDLLEKETDGAQLYEPIHCVDKTIEFAFSHTDGHRESYLSFVNGTYRKEVNIPLLAAGSKHLAAFREGILQGINEYSGKKFINADVRDGLVGILSIKISDTMSVTYPGYELVNAEICTWIANQVRGALFKYLSENTSVGEALINKIQHNAKVRKEAKENGESG